MHLRKSPLLHSGISMPSLNVANVILKSCNEDAQLFRNQDNLNYHEAKPIVYRLNFLLCFITLLSP